MKARHTVQLAPVPLVTLEVNLNIYKIKKTWHTVIRLGRTLFHFYLFLTLRKCFTTLNHSFTTAKR